MILAAAPDATHRILVDGCGIGTYVEKLNAPGIRTTGLDIEVDRVREARQNSLSDPHPPTYLGGAGEALPFPTDCFDLILSHEVLEHVQDDRAAVREIVRTLRPGGRLALFCPNHGYPYETHGIYWQGEYHFGNIPLVNYLPRAWRNRLAPHVRVYSRRDLENLFAGLPVRYIKRTVVFGAYDNIIRRHPRLGRVLRSVLQTLENTPLRFFGLSHFWVVEKVSPTKEHEEELATTKNTKHTNKS